MSYFIVTVDPTNQLAGLTIKEALERWFLATNRIKILERNNWIYLNNHQAKLTDLLKDQDTLIIDTSSYDQIDYLPEDKPIDIIYQDQYLLIINKPAKIIIHPDQKQGLDTLANVVANYYYQSEQNYQIRHVHRLDYDTTGAIIYAKDLITAAALSKMIELGTLKRSYLAICEGHFNSLGGIINQPIGQDRHLNGKRRISVTGQPAITNYQVLKKLDHNLSLVQLRLETGRTHQIRVHMASINHPLLGDQLYGANYQAPRVMLHSYQVIFKHPITNQPLKITVEPPADFKSWLK